MVNNSKEQWIKDRREKFRCPYCGEVVGCSDDGVIGIFSKKLFTKHVNVCCKFNTR